MDTPWLYVYTKHKLTHLQRHTLQLTLELTTSKWLTTRNLVLEGIYRDRGREREARLELYTPAVTYFQVSSDEAASASDHSKHLFLVFDSGKLQLVCTVGYMYVSVRVCI